MSEPKAEGEGMKDEGMTHHVIVTAIVAGQHVVLSRWDMDQEPTLKSKTQLALSKALVLRLAKHLNREAGA